METDFIDWLTNELIQRSWSNSELARRAEMVPSTVSMVLNRKSNPGFDFCTSVARALGLPPEQILRRAGLLRPLPPPVAEEEEIVSILRSLTASTRRTVIAMLRGLAQHTPPAPPIVDSLESQLLEVFRRLPPAKQDQILEDLTNQQDSRIMRLIGEEDETRTDPA